MDTQWPRFEVFEQERPDLPHRNAGAVHAPDSELALQNARDVFARRPATVSLWVAPAASIYSRTAEELAAAPPEAAPATDGPAQTYLVFQKITQRQGETFVAHAGQVEARSAPEALHRARERFSGETVYVWWIVPASAVTASEPDDTEPMFQPAHAKTHRMPNQYQVQRQMREALAAAEHETAE